MPCRACVDRILGIFLREITSSNVTTSAAPRVAYGPKWRCLSTQRRTARQSCRSSLPSPAATSNVPKLDLYVPFDEVLTAERSLPLPRKATGSEHRFFRNDVDHAGSGASTISRQGATNGGERLAQALKASPKALDIPSPERNYLRLWPSSSPKGAPEELHDGRAFVELSPDTVDAIAAEAAAGESMYMVLPKGGDKREGEICSRTLMRAAQKDGRVDGGVAATITGVRVRLHAKPWQIQKDALEARFGSSGWNPRKRLSPDALDGIRALNTQFPDKYTTPVLAEQFKVSPEAIRRILKSKWRPNGEEVEERRARWDKRGEKIWGKMVELGVKPPKKWREMGIGKRKVDVLRSGRRGLVERSSRKLWSIDGSEGEGVNPDDWDEETLAERIL
ncbi:MAG: Required for respiratory growth protein 9 mitochondrial [Geoglossum umbratile]|nr:MAG: Required for respiratory growth protein 9 mitochondrial [Geoglossum umbratile]